MMRIRWLFGVMGLLALDRISADEVPVPRTQDTRLELSLLVSEPAVVTPVALAADGAGDLYVLETNTHARNSEYSGPEEDRVYRFHDSNGDGDLDHQSVCAENLRNALSLVAADERRLFVLQMKSLLVLDDHDGDGLFEDRKTLLTIRTDNNNHHGVFLALAQDNRKSLYVTLGNIGGNAYEMEGADGIRIGGQGDTGLIVRIGDDGTGLTRFAHGFWNPCDLKFDTSGRLLATDNDPDARGPNRVLHIVQGGRYGYKARFGGSGLHPYDAWNGELPGTLPMLAGVGEAPVGLFDCNASALPADYAGNLLVAVWGTNQVVRVTTKRQGLSLSGEVEPLIVGEAGFRPTGIAATTDGTVYIGDWADRRYPVHGKGRIWRLRTKPGVERLIPQMSFSGKDASQELLSSIIDGTSDDSFEDLFQRAKSDDPFEANASLTALGTSSNIARLTNVIDESDREEDRLVALLALRQGGIRLEKTRISELLRDPSARVRQMAMIWSGETHRWDLADEIAETMGIQTESASLFETFLATSQLLSDVERQRVRKQEPGSRIKRDLDQGLIRRLLRDESVPESARCMAVRYLKDEGNKENRKLLAELIRSPNSLLAREAIRTLGLSGGEQARKALLELGQRADRPAIVRADAIRAMGLAELGTLEALTELAHDEDSGVALAALRSLGTSGEHPSIKGRLKVLLDGLDQSDTESPLIKQLRFAIAGGSPQPRPETVEEWGDVLEGGDVERGRRVFFDARANCVKCHRVEGRGGHVGPDLSNLGQAKTAKQILESILNPSSEKSPDYQGYAVVMQDGEIHIGTQFHFRGESAELLTTDGNWIRFALDDTEEYRALDRSLMPDDLVKLLSVEEVRDLTAFLKSSGSTEMNAAADD